MARIQIELPDEMYRRLKELAAQQEWTLAEAIRRGTEQLLAMYPPEVKSRGEWRLPRPKRLGIPKAHVRDCGSSTGR